MFFHFSISVEICNPNKSKLHLFALPIKCPSMRNKIQKLLPENNTKRLILSVSVTLVIATILTIFGIYGIGRYGMALFILTPLFIGFCPALLYGLKNGIAKNEARDFGFLTLLFFTAGLLGFAIEGLICIGMAAPLGILFTWLGSLLACATLNKLPQNAPNILMLFVALIPFMSFVEKDNKTQLTSVVTSIDVNASPEKVWKNVVEFPELQAPSELLFKAGIAYPINAKIEGKGVGAVRYCNFTTGSFVEPITLWDEPHQLSFDVKEQPAPMKELSFWDIDAPHLHDYFVSKKGQFKLIQLPNGNTRLEGTTWYYHNIGPSFYWRIWSNYIIHKIHNRVLTHIKQNSEKP